MTAAHWPLTEGFLRPRTDVIGSNAFMGRLLPLGIGKLRRGLSPALAQAISYNRHVGATRDRMGGINSGRRPNGRRPTSASIISGSSERKRALARSRR